MRADEVYRSPRPTWSPGPRPDQVEPKIAGEQPGPAAIGGAPAAPSGRYGYGARLGSGTAFFRPRARNAEGAEPSLPGKGDRVDALPGSSSPVPLR
ncbi:MAG TPA: hypothetical protein VIU29_05245, partial [Candidatus Deferrimicrobiaceae bacterium]